MAARIEAFSFAFTVLLLLVSPVSAGQEATVKQQVGQGAVDWTNRTVLVNGKAPPDPKVPDPALARQQAEPLAKVAARDNLIEALRQLRFSGTKPVAGLLDETPALTAKLTTVIDAFKPIETKYYSDGGVDLVVQGTLDTVLTEIILTAAPSKNTVPPAAADDGTTGVVVNAKGLKASPAVAPRLVDESGAELYGASAASADAVRRHGVVSYTRSIDQGLRDARVGSKPIVVKAVRLTEPGSADLVVGIADAEKLRRLTSVLAGASVIIVID